jgi:hypothetical protein
MEWGLQETTSLKMHGILKEKNDGYLVDLKWIADIKQIKLI